MPKQCKHETRQYYTIKVKTFQDKRGRDKAKQDKTVQGTP